MSRRTRRNVGVIGLGIIGSRVAENLRQHGFHVFVWNRTPRPVPNFVGSPAEVAELCDFVQIFVSDDEALLAMAQQITSTLTAHHVVMAHCTVSPDTMRAAADIVQRRGAQFLDAPFTGSKVAAERGQLVYYIGGDEIALRHARPVLEASSKEILEIGEIGQATTIKVATNMITAATVQGAAEALALVHSSGLSPDKFTTAMRNNGSNSATLDMKLPLMVSGNFETNFSVKHMLKDVAIASRLARSFGLEFGATDAAREGLLGEAKEGRGDADYSSLSRRFFPEGGPLNKPQPLPETEDDQPRLALEEEKPREPEGDSQRNGEVETQGAAPTSEEKKAEEEEERSEVESSAVDEAPGLAEVRDESGSELPAALEATKVEEARGETAPTESEPKPAAEVENRAPEDVPSESVRDNLPAEEKKTPAPQKMRNDADEEVEPRRGMFSRFWRRGIDD